MARHGPPPAAPLADQQPFWEPIGRLVFVFGHLEAQIDWCISALLGADSGRGEPSVASQIRNICSRIALVEALFRERIGEADRRAELRRIIIELGAVIKFRNGVLHGVWGACLEDGRVWQKPRTHPVDLRAGSFEVTIEAIDEQVRRAAEIGDALVKLVQAVSKEHVPKSTPAASERPHGLRIGHRSRRGSAPRRGRASP